MAVTCPDQLYALAGGFHTGSHPLIPSYSGFHRHFREPCLYGATSPQQSHRLSGRGGFWSFSALTTPPPLGIRVNRLSGFQSNDCPVFEWKGKGRTLSPPFLENPVRNVFVVSRPKWLLSKFHILVISKNIFMRRVKRIGFESKTQAHVALSKSGNCWALVTSVTVGLKHILPGSLFYLEDQVICLVTMFWKL